MIWGVIGDICEYEVNEGASESKSFSRYKHSRYGEPKRCWVH